jgi:hypothetical protein
VGVGVALDLGVHGGQHLGMGVAQRGDGGAAAGVEVGAAGTVGDGDAAGLHGERRRTMQVAVDDVAHGASFLVGRKANDSGDRLARF